MYQFLNDIQRKRFFNSVLVVIIIFAIFLAVEAISIVKKYPYANGYSDVIVVNGKGEVFAIPDTGMFSFSVVEDGKTVKEAQDKSNKKMKSILDSIKSMGIEEKDIKTVGYYSNPKYEYSQTICTQSYPSYCPPGKQILTGYEVSQTISVKVRDTDKAGDALTKVGSLGATNISGLSFVVDDEDKVKTEARTKAIADAKAQAKVLAKSLGVKLGKVVSFSESGNYPMPYYGGVMMDKAVSARAEIAPTSPELPVGENEIISNVSITYEIR